MFRVLLVGANEEEAVGAKATREQISAVRELECAVLGPGGEALTWDVFDDPQEPRTIFRTILADRQMRIDQRVAMADRPMFAVVTANGHRAVRLEYYEGHDALELQYDLRAAELRTENLPPFMSRDPHSYDPAAFLEQAFGLPRAFTEPLLRELHRKKGDSDGNTG